MTIPPEMIEKVARIIDPWAWSQFDLACQPYRENRGSNGIENYWYQTTYRFGCRSEEDVITYWRAVDKPALDEAIALWRRSFETATAAIRTLAPMMAEVMAEMAEAEKWGASHVAASLKDGVDGPEWYNQGLDDGIIAIRAKGKEMADG